MRARYWIVRWLVVSWLLACGSSPNSPLDTTPLDTTPLDTTPLDMTLIDGEEPVDADTYVSGLEKVGVQGVYTVKLFKSDPIPKYTDIYTWTLGLFDADGQVVSGAMVVAEPIMLAHGHGTFPQFTTAIETASATYDLVDLDLFMDGIWHVTIRIIGANGTEDEVAFNFDLEG